MIRIGDRAPIDLHQERSTQHAVVRDGQGAYGRAWVDHGTSERYQAAVEGAVAFQRLSIVKIQATIRAPCNIQNSAASNRELRAVAEGPIASQLQRSSIYSDGAS